MITVTLNENEAKTVRTVFDKMIERFGYEELEEMFGEAVTESMARISTELDSHPELD